MPAKTYDNDGFLLKMLGADDGRALQTLYHKHQAHLSNIIKGMIGDPEAAKDILQDLFFALWERRYSLKATKSLKAYLVRSAINRSLNYLRDKNRHKTTNFEETKNIEKLQERNSFEHPMELEELKNIIKSAMKGLSPKSRAAFLLKKNHHMSYQEIAAHLGISKKAVEKRISKALKHLNGEIKPYLKSLLLLFII